MLPGSDTMGAPSSFTSRRPHASNLPQFELPPPQLPGFGKFPSYNGPQLGHSNPSTSLTSVGNLLTPPSNSSVESPTSSVGITSASSTSTQPMAPYTPSGYSWSQSAPAVSGYGYHTSMSPSAFAPSKGLFSPSINSLVKGTNSPSTNELPAPQYSTDLSAYQSSMSISAPALPAMQHAMSQPSPLTTQGPFSRPPPTPTYSYSSSHPSSSTTQSYQYSAGPSPVQQSPVGIGGLSGMSPSNGHSSQIPSIHAHQQSQSPYAPQRPFSYSLPGPVLSNINHPGNQLALVGGMSSGMVPGYNSGHAAQMHMYGHGPSSAANERPFKCDQCPQSFNRNHDLKRHKRIHLAVKPFPCGHCDKSFSRKDALKRHILVKGCGKVQANRDVDKSDGSISPGSRSDMTESSPVIPAAA